ncbi:hypothetical protein [Kribbella deserti]|uniref:Class I SAM-dependent methyltransferase n=1 Tax=Kribbella deserti TaxID=1926257 RepID=A0ABV6QJ10_9ACTN
MNERLSLVGGEILEWSDLDPVSGPAAMSGPVAVPLLRSLIGGSDRVLVAGPHHLDVLTALGASAGGLDLLVRSADDATALAGKFPDAQVICGGLDRVEAKPEYDVVIALDGITRLYGPDSNELTWQQSVETLRRLVKPGGRLILAVSNNLGLDELISAANTGLPTDDAWPRLVSAEPPSGLANLEKALGHKASYAVYPSTTQPHLTVSASLLTDHADDPLLQATIATAMDPAEAFTDPRHTVRDVLTNGLGLPLAPAWWFILGAEATGLPAVLAAEPGADDQPLVVSLDRQDERRWARRVVSGNPAPGRNLSGRNDVVVPPGALLEDRLLAACRVDDQENLQALATAYVRWLAGQQQALIAVPDNVVVTPDNGFAVLDPAWQLKLSADAKVVAVRNLTRYAVRQLAAGVRSPWPAGARPEELVARLAAGAGIECDQALFEAAAKLDAEVAAETGPRFAPAAEIPVPQGLREAAAAITRLSAEIEDLRSQVSWLEVTVNRIRGSRTYRVGGMVLRPASKLRALTRRIPGKGA